MELHQLNNSELKRNSFFNSVLVWYIDSSKNKNEKKFFFSFHFLFYVFSFLAFFYFVLESILRFVFVRRTSSIDVNAKKVGYIFFAPSHLKVLLKIKKHNSDKFSDYEHVYISSRKVSELLKVNLNYLDISSYQNLKSNLKFILEFGKYFFSNRRELIQILKKIKQTDLKLFLKLSFKLAQSIRFRSWVDEFYILNQIEFIYAGNDSCYRSYWLSNRKKVKTCTIQHGIAENIIQYYSISNYFICWDKNTMQTLIKNSSTEYLIAGYPKNKIKFDTNRLIDKSILIILTKLNSNDIEPLKSLIQNLKKYSDDLKIKFHPSDEKLGANLFNQRLIYEHTKNQLSCFQNFIVIDSTFGLDLDYSGVKIIPLSFNQAKTFNLYFPFKSVEDFSKLISNSSIELFHL